MPNASQVVKFATSLGWDKPVRRSSRLIVEGKRLQLKWYEVGSIDDILFQVNLQAEPHAIVIAMRYGIYTGAHYVDLAVDEPATQYELFLCSHFSSRDGRRRFRIQFPRYAKHTWTTLRALPPFAEDW